MNVTSVLKLEEVVFNFKKNKNKLLEYFVFVLFLLELSGNFLDALNYSLYERSHIVED